MTEPVYIDGVADANWINEIQRRKGRAIPTPSALPGEQAHLTAPELFAYPGQPRDNRGRFGSGGGTRIGVSRERPELGGSEIRTHADIEAARRNPVIAEAERTTTDDLEDLDIDVKSQTQVSGVFEGGGEPSLMVRLGPGSSLEDIEVAGAYMVRRNQQDSVIVTVGGAEMERLGLTPNATTIRIEGLPTDPAMQERLFSDIQAHTPFASWDEKRGTVAVSSFDADIDDDMRAGLAGLAMTHGGRMTSEPVHERWYFQDEQLRKDATAYLHPADPSVLRTPGEVRSDYPGERTAAIPDPRPGSSATDVRGGGSTGAEGAHLRDHPPGAVTQGLTTWAYDPNQPRRPDGKFGTKGGGGGGAPTPTLDVSPTDGRIALENVGMTADLGGIGDGVRGQVVDALRGEALLRPQLFDAISVHVTTGPLEGATLAETRISTYNGVPLKNGYKRGEATIVLDDEHFGDAAKITEAVKGAHAKGFLAGDDVPYAMRHEVGHVLDAALEWPSSPGVMRPGGPMVQDSHYVKAMREGGHAGTVSGYGKTSPGERFAEEYAQLSGGVDPGTASAAVLQQLMGKHR